MLEVHSSRSDWASPRERLNLRRFADSAGDQLLLLLAVDRVGHSSQQGSSAFDDRVSKDQPDDAPDNWTLTDESLAVALADWR
jgi:hypothetical protein